MTEEKKKTIIKVVGGIVIAILLMLGGFFIGRATMKGKTTIKIEYVELPPIHDTITNLIPKEIYIPADTADIIRECIKDGIYSELFPEKAITEYIEITKEDTAKVLIDWATKRKYSELLFDIDTVGKCNVEAIVQYNRIDSLSYVFTPIQKTITIDHYDVKLFSPYVGVGFDVNGIGKVPTFDAHVEGGFYIKEKYGVGVDYRYDFLDKSHSVGGKILFKF